MDPVSHAALGAACSQVVLHPVDKKNAWLVGAIGGLAADVDIIIRSAYDPMLALIYHRHFTHSLIFIPIGALLVTLVLMPFKRFSKQWKLTFLAALIGYSTHALLDACTSYGTLLLWPFTLTRYAFDIISIIDPFLTLPLVIGVWATYFFDNRAFVLAGIIAAGLFLGFNIMQHQRALAAVNAYAQERQWSIKKLRVFPQLASSTKWRAVFYSGKQIVLAQVKIPLTAKSRVYHIAKFTRFQRQQLPDYVDDTGLQLRDFKIFDWFADGYLIMTSRQPMVLVDARYVMGDKSLTALWGIQFRPDKVHVSRLRFIPLHRQQ